MKTTAITRTNSYLPGMLGRSIFDDAFFSFFNDVPTYVKQSTQGYPVTDIYSEVDGSTVMEFALAGFKRDELTIEVKPEHRCLTVSAHANEDLERSERRIARRSFTKTYVNYNDDLELAKVNATFEDGLLRIVIPKRPETKPIKIDIA